MKRALTTLAYHAVYAVGLGAVVYGCWLIFKPVGYIVGGLLLLGISFLVEKDSSR